MSKVNKQNNTEIELGFSEIGKFPKAGNYLILTFENGIKRVDMD